MRERLLKRMEELKAELESGQRMLAEIAARRESLQCTLLRIGGAIQVLEEECARDQAEGEDANSKPEKALRVAASG